MLEIGGTELLVSSLKYMETFKAEDLMDLYGMRLGVEEGKKILNSK